MGSKQCSKLVPNNLNEGYAVSLVDEMNLNEGYAVSLVDEMNCPN
jgi:hypothetical protein